MVVEGEPNPNEQKPQKEKKEKKEKKDKKDKKNKDPAEETPQPQDETFEIDPDTVIPKTELELLKCPTTEVCVYTNRAEVTRLIEVENIQAGPHEIVIKGLQPSSVEESSIRVSGGTGAATILEVSNQIIRPEAPQLPDTSKEDEEAEKIRTEQIANLNKKKASLQTGAQRLDKELKLLQDFSTEVKSTLCASDSVSRTNMDPISFSSAGEMLKFYDTERDKIQDKIWDITDQIEDIDQQIQDINDEFYERKKKRPSPPAAKEPYREVSVLLHAKEATKVTMKLHYIINNAKWEPGYDIRVQSKDKSIQLIYYGFITNGTKEPWKNVKLSLSTAMAGVSGYPPELKTQYVALRQPQPMYYAEKEERKSTSNRLFSARNKMKEASANPMYEEARSSSLNALYDEEEISSSLAPPKPITVMTSAVTESQTSSTFTIPRASSIASDNKPHKVTIALVNLDGSFSYTVLPQKSQHAYLRANCVNNSEYPFLEGKMNVFMDNAFIASSRMKRTNPSEDLSLFLGIDNAITVEFKEETFSNDTKGIISKSKSINYKYTTRIKNTKQFQVDVSVFQNYPKATEDKVKVTMLKPNLKEDSTVILNDFNNLRWSLKIAPGVLQKLEYEYSVEFPPDRQIQFT